MKNIFRGTILAAFLTSSPAFAQNGNMAVNDTGQTSVPLRPIPATSQTLIASPTAPASTAAYTMQGLAASITPTTSGTVEINISGTIVAPAGTTVDNGIKYQISYGTGTAPTNGAALTGTQVGSIQTFTLFAAATAAADVNQPFTTVALVTGLKPGTAYWIDLAAESVTTISQMGVANVTVLAQETR